jgi:predicted DNA-binding transcriptional regulator AlpA
MNAVPATAPVLPANVAPLPNWAEVLVYNGDELATALGVARKTITRMDQSGKLPLPLRISGRKRWLRSEISAWLRAGAPPRRDWEAMKR